MAASGMRRLAGLLLGLCLAVLGADWPHLRGPRYNGLSPETGLAESWPEEGPPVLWRISLGQGYSGMVVVGRQVYTQYQSLSGQYVVCLDADTGERLWRRRYGYPWEPESDWPGPMATPTVHGGKVYFAGAFGLVGCLDASDGRLLWSVNVTETFDGYGTEYGYACTPLVESGKVYLPVGGQGASVVALDAQDGSVAWTSGDDVASYSPAYPITVGGRRQIVVYLRNDVVAFDPATGQELWRHPWSKGYDEHAAWPVYQEPYLLTASAFRQGAKVLRLGLGPDGPTAELVWHSKELSNDVVSSLILDGHIYGFDLHDLQPRGTRPARGQFKCIELATGEVRWATDRTGHATVVAADGKLILLNEAGELVLARATPERYEELSKARVFRGEVCWTPPTLSRRRLYLRNKVHAACVYLGPPEALSAAELAKARRATEAADRPAGRLAAVWTGASLYAPTTEDMTRWFGWCGLGVLLPAGLLALGVRAALPRRRAPALPFRIVFWGGCFVFGAAGTVCFSLLAETFVLTWPVSVFAAYQVLLVLALGARRGQGRARWAFRLAVLAFGALCFGYYHLCRSLFVVAGYGFLAGLLPAFPVGLVAAWRMRGTRWALVELAWASVSFSAYFWASAAVTVWRIHA